MLSCAPFRHKDHMFIHWDSHYKGGTVVWTSYFYHTRKMSFCYWNNSIICACVLWSFSKSDEERKWWRHQMKTFSALLALCAGNSPVSGEFPTQRPVTRSFDFFYLRLNKLLSKQPWGWWSETPSCSLLRHCNDIIALGDSYSVTFNIWKGFMGGELLILSIFVKSWRVIW